MIGKIKKGSGFKGCVNYVLGKEQAVLLHADGVLTESRFQCEKREQEYHQHTSR